MRFILLVLSVLTGSEASSVEGCRQGWVEFICKYPETHGNYTVIYVRNTDRQLAPIRSTKKNDWEAKGNLSVYHDTVKKNLRVHIKELTHSVKYKCEFHKQPQQKRKEEEEKVKIKIDNNCHSFLSLNVSKGNETTINCDYLDNDNDDDDNDDEDNDDENGVRFFCKENTSTCEDILSTTSNFNHTKTDRGLIVSISNVSSDDAGVYWCGVRSGDGNRAGRRRIQLQVKDASTMVTPSVTTSAATPPVSFTQSTSAAANGDDGSWLIVIIAVVTCVLLLLILIFGWKRFKQIKKTRNTEVQNKKQDGLYEEIQERPQQPDLGTALKSIYVTADFPTNPLASHHLPNIYAHIGSGQSVSGNAVQEVERRPAQSAVNQPSKPPDDPFYSTLNLPQPL